MCWSIFSTFPLFISLSLWRRYRRICFKWANNTFFKIYKHDRIISFFIGWPQHASKQSLKCLSLAIHRTNTRKVDLVKVCLELDFNHPNRKLQENKSPQQGHFQKWQFCLFLFKYLSWFFFFYSSIYCFYHYLNHFGLSENEAQKHADNAQRL